MTDRTNANFLQVLMGQVREDPLVDLVVAECRLVFFEARAPAARPRRREGVCPVASCPKLDTPRP